MSLADELEITDRMPDTVSPYSTGIMADGTPEDFFPEIDPEFTPFGTRVLVQLRRVMDRTKSGIILSQETKDTEDWNVQVAKLIKVGPLAFKKRDTAAPWPEGVWASVGDFVRVPRWGGDRWSVETKDGAKVALLVLNDHELIGRFDGNPLKVRSYVL